LFFEFLNQAKKRKTAFYLLFNYVCRVGEVCQQRKEYREVLIAAAVSGQIDVREEKVEINL
jgi:hypothetical protein